MNKRAILGSLVLVFALALAVVPSVAAKASVSPCGDQSKACIPLRNPQANIPAKPLVD
jgi:hypothetical protein